VRANAQIEDDVRSALDDDPRIPDAGVIAIAVDDGGVTLRGTVGRFSHRRAAMADARKIPGVVDVGDSVTLSGFVEAASQRDRASRIALGVGGVAHVDNKLRVFLPA
jgi:osmotically-inducible protein OsmY